MDKINKFNRIILEKLSYYLTYHEKDIKGEDLQTLIKLGVDELVAYRILLSTFMNLKNREIENLYFDRVIHKFSPNEFENNPYYKTIKWTETKYKDWELKIDSYEPYELFVCDDFQYNKNQVFPQVGYFDKTFKFPAIFQKNRLWMSVTPNEINTMKEPIEKATGKVLTLGLGLGYYPFMVSNKEDVDSITIVELDKNVIDLFKKFILPQFPHKEKVNIIHANAYKYMKKIKDGDYDYIFVDIYHDAGDGLDVFENLSQYTSRFRITKSDYWILNTIKYYLG